MDLVPLRLAAAQVPVAGSPSQSLIAAGFTLLQRCAPLVRALAGRRSALLLPPSAAALTALAASDGHGALLLDPSSPSSWPSQLKDSNVGAIFTLHRHLPALGNVPLPRVLLDEVPAAAQLIPAPSLTAPTEPRRIDLGSHFGLNLEGTLDDPLRDEEFVCFYRNGAAATDARESLTHRSIVENARVLENDASAPELIRKLILPLLAGRAIAGG